MVRDPFDGSSGAQLPVDGSQAAIDQCEDFVRQTERILVTTRANNVDGLKMYG